MSVKRSSRLQPIGARELARVAGAGMLVPAVQKFRGTMEPMSAGTIYVKFEGISGDATE